MEMPTPPTTIDENILRKVLQNKEVFIKYDMAAIHQLYSMIRNAKGALTTTILFEKQYREKAERLLRYLQKEYHLD
jgi:hypothetical protein